MRDAMGSLIRCRTPPARSILEEPPREPPVVLGLFAAVFCNGSVSAEKRRSSLHRLSSVSENQRLVSDWKLWSVPQWPGRLWSKLGGVVGEAFGDGIVGGDAAAGGGDGGSGGGGGGRLS
jgi:hypothetical protein